MGLRLNGVRCWVSVRMDSWVRIKLHSLRSFHQQHRRTRCLTHRWKMANKSEPRGHHVSECGRFGWLADIPSPGFIGRTHHFTGTDSLFSSVSKAKPRAIPCYWPIRCVSHTKPGSNQLSSATCCCWLHHISKDVHNRSTRSSLSAGWMAFLH